MAKLCPVRNRVLYEHRILLNSFNVTFLPFNSGVLRLAHADLPLWVLENVEGAAQAGTEAEAV